MKIAAWLLPVVVLTTTPSFAQNPCEGDKCARISLDAYVNDGLAGLKIEGPGAKVLYDALKGQHSVDTSPVAAGRDFLCTKKTGDQYECVIPMKNVYKGELGSTDELRALTDRERDPPVE